MNVNKEKKKDYAWNYAFQYINKFAYRNSDVKFLASCKQMIKVTRLKELACRNASRIGNGTPHTVDSLITNKKFLWLMWRCLCPALAKSCEEAR